MTFIIHSFLNKTFLNSLSQKVIQIKFLHELNFGMESKTRMTSHAFYLARMASHHWRQPWPRRSKLYFFRNKTEQNRQIIFLEKNILGL